MIEAQHLLVDQGSEPVLRVTCSRLSTCSRLYSCKPLAALYVPDALETAISLIRARCTQKSIWHTYKAATAIFWPCLSGRSPGNMLVFSLFVREQSPARCAAKKQLALPFRVSRLVPGQLSGFDPGQLQRLLYIYIYIYIYMYV